MAKQDNIFIIMWDMTGLECVIDANELQGEDVMRALRDKKGSKLGQTMFAITMRARANMHRKYEIYSIHTVPEITKEVLEEMFKDTPQTAADMIRKHGHKIYSDRDSAGNQVIT